MRQHQHPSQSQSHYGNNKIPAMTKTLTSMTTTTSMTNTNTNTKPQSQTQVQMQTMDTSKSAADNWKGIGNRHMALMVISISWLDVLNPLRFLSKLHSFIHSFYSFEKIHTPLNLTQEYNEAYKAYFTALSISPLGPYHPIFLFRRVGSNDETADCVVNVTLIREVFKSKWFGRFLFVFFDVWFVDLDLNLGTFACAPTPFSIPTCVFVSLFVSVSLSVRDFRRMTSLQSYTDGWNGHIHRATASSPSSVPTVAQSVGSFGVNDNENVLSYSPPLPCRTITHILICCTTPSATVLCIPNVLPPAVPFESHATNA